MNETPAGVAIEMDEATDRLLRQYGFVRRPIEERLQQVFSSRTLYGNVIPAGGGGTTTESPRDMEKANEQAVDRVVEYLTGKKGALHPKHIDMVESAVQKARRDQAVGRAIARAAFRHSAGLDPAP